MWGNRMSYVVNATLLSALMRHASHVRQLALASGGLGPSRWIRLTQPRPRSGLFLVSQPQQSVQIHQPVTAHILASVGHGTLHLGVARAFSLRSFLPEPPERPRHRDLGGYGVAGFFFGSGQRSGVPPILPGTMGLRSCGCSCCSLPSPD
jgi:hypothetical protein